MTTRRKKEIIFGTFLAHLGYNWGICLAYVCHILDISWASLGHMVKVKVRVKLKINH